MKTITIFRNVFEVINANVPHEVVCWFEQAYGCVLIAWGYSGAKTKPTDMVDGRRQNEDVANRNENTVGIE